MRAKLETILYIATEDRNEERISQMDLKFLKESQYIVRDDASQTIHEYLKMFSNNKQLVAMDGFSDRARIARTKITSKVRFHRNLIEKF